VAIRSETVQVSGIRCERCVARLGGALRGVDGIEAANANLMGRVALSWDDERTSREAILDAMSKAGFRAFDAVSGE
jgi:copper chaperone CopZ